MWGTKRDDPGNIYPVLATANYGGPVDPQTSERGALWKIVPASRA